MPKFFITNKRTVDGEAVPLEYDFGGETRVFAPGERREVPSMEEAQIVLSRLPFGASLEEEPDAAPVVEIAEEDLAAEPTDEKPEPDEEPSPRKRRPKK